MPLIHASCIFLVLGFCGYFELCIFLVLGFCGYFERLVSAMMAGLLLSSRETVASECKIRWPLSSMRFTYAGNQGLHDLHEHSTILRKNI